MRNQIASIGINQSEETYLLAPKSLYKGEPLLLYLLLPFAKRYRSLKNRHKHTLLNKCNILEVKFWQIYFLVAGAGGDFHTFLLSALKAETPRTSNPTGYELDEELWKSLSSWETKSVFNSNWSWLAPMDIGHRFLACDGSLGQKTTEVKGVFLGHQ